MKTKEEKEVLEHFAGVVSNQRSTVNYIARVHNNVILHNFTCYIKACLCHCNEVHMHLYFHLLPLSLSPSLSFPLLPSFLLPPFFLSLPPSSHPSPPTSSQWWTWVCSRRSLRWRWSILLRGSSPTMPSRSSQTHSLPTPLPHPPLPRFSSTSSWRGRR